MTKPIATLGASAPTADELQESANKAATVAGFHPAAWDIRISGPVYIETEAYDFSLRSVTCHATFEIYPKVTPGPQEGADA